MRAVVAMPVMMRRTLLHHARKTDGPVPREASFFAFLCFKFPCQAEFSFGPFSGYERFG